jgi:hypothetical protein
MVQQPERLDSILERLAVTRHSWDLPQLVVATVAQTATQAQAPRRPMADQAAAVRTAMVPETATGAPVSRDKETSADRLPRPVALRAAGGKVQAEQIPQLARQQ